MKKIITSILFITVIISNSFSQLSGNYTLFIQHDTAIQWAAECDKLINLTPKVQAFSLKKWYLEKIKSGIANAYLFNNGQEEIKKYQLSLSTLATPDWLKGLSIELPGYKNPKEWYFVDATMPKDDHNRYKYRTGNLNFSTDSCCGCDDANAFRAKQILNYKNGKFSIYNVFISPLCARQRGSGLVDWYPFCNVAYNDNAERKFPGLSKDVVLLNTDVVEYNFSPEYPTLNDSVLTIYRTDIGSLIYQDILKGNLKAIDTETGIPIPVKKLLTMNMPADTMAVFDIDDPSKITGYKVLQQERSPAGFNRIRIEQDLFFDFKNERLFSIIKSVMLMEGIYTTNNNQIMGYRAFARLVLR